MSEEEFTIVLLQTSSSTKCYILSKHSGEFITFYEDKNRYISKKWGYFELNPEELFEKAENCISKTVENFITQKHDKNKITSMTICTERNITVVWSRTSSKHLYNALGEDDTRCEDTCQKLIHKSWRRNITNYQHLVGLPMSSRWMGVKLRWLMDHVPAVRNALAERDLMAGTLDSWLAWKLSSYKILTSDQGDIDDELLILPNQHYTGITTASPTMLMNLHRCNWDPTVCAFLEIDPSGGALPTITSENNTGKSNELFVSRIHPVIPGVPITCLVSQESAALIGLITAYQLSGNNSSSSINQTGTINDSLLTNQITGPISNESLTGVVSLHFDSDTGRGRISLVVGEEPVIYRSMIGGVSFGGYPLSAVIHHDSESGTNYYSIETPFYSSENFTNWLQNKMKLIGPDDDLDAIANSVSDNGGVCVLPNTTGPITLYSTNDCVYSSGAISNVSQLNSSGHDTENTYINKHNNIDVWAIDLYNTQPGHIVRATMEMVASEVSRWLNAVQKSLSNQILSNQNRSILYVSGDHKGLAGSEVFCQILADIVGRQVCRLSNNLCPADVVGAALLGNLSDSSNYYGNMKTSMATIPIDRYECLMSPGERFRHGLWWEREITASVLPASNLKSRFLSSKHSAPGGTNNANVILGPGRRAISLSSPTISNNQSTLSIVLMKLFAVFSIGLPFTLIGYGLATVVTVHKINLLNWFNRKN